MRLLLDTHVYLWALDNTNRLGARTRALITDRNNDIFVSIVSLWEIVLKSDKLKADVPRVLQAVEPSGFILLPLAIEHLEAQLGRGKVLADPFDALLIAQADHEHLTLATEDEAILSRQPVDLIECSTGRRSKRRP